VREEPAAQDVNWAGPLHRYNLALRSSPQIEATIGTGS
jgi:hypothetical protein